LEETNHVPSLSIKQESRPKSNLHSEVLREYVVMGAILAVVIAAILIMVSAEIDYNFSL
jgi:hypothetical protein